MIPQGISKEQVIDIYMEVSFLARWKRKCQIWQVRKTSMMEWLEIIEQGGECCKLNLDG